jgi:hypothetical protein
MPETEGKKMHMLKDLKTFISKSKIINESGDSKYYKNSY